MLGPVVARDPDVRSLGRPGSENATQLAAGGDCPTGRCPNQIMPFAWPLRPVCHVPATTLYTDSSHRTPIASTHCAS